MESARIRYTQSVGARPPWEVAYCTDTPGFGDELVRIAKLIICRSNADRAVIHLAFTRLANGAGVIA